MILILFFKENAFISFFCPSEDVNIIIIFIPMNAAFCWEDLQNILMGLVILMVLQGRVAPEASLWTTQDIY